MRYRIVILNCKLGRLCQEIVLIYFKITSGIDLKEVKGVTKGRLGIIQTAISWVLEDNTKVLEEHTAFSTRIEVTHKTTQCNSPEDHDLDTHHCEKLSTLE
jgi:hypothetical protein